MLEREAHKMSKTDQMRHDSDATIRATKVRSRTCNGPQHLWDRDLANNYQTETFNEHNFRIATPRVKLNEQFLGLAKEKNRLWSCLRGFWRYYLLLFTKRLRLHGPCQH